MTEQEAAQLKGYLERELKEGAGGIAERAGELTLELESLFKLKSPKFVWDLESIDRGQESIGKAKNMV